MSIDAVQALNEVVTKLDAVDWSRCHAVRDCKGWLDLWKKRHGLDQPDWMHDALTEYSFPPDDEDDEDETLDGLYYEQEDEE